MLLIKHDFGLKPCYSQNTTKSSGMNLYKKKGMEKGILSSIFNLMQSSQMTSEQAMKMLLVPESKWAFYIEQLNKLQKSE